MYQSPTLNAAYVAAFFVWPILLGLGAQWMLDTRKLWLIAPASYFFVLAGNIALYAIMPWHLIVASTTTVIADIVSPPSDHTADVIFFTNIFLTPLLVAISAIRLHKRRSALKRESVS